MRRVALTTAALLLVCVPAAFAAWPALERDGVFGSTTARMVLELDDEHLAAAVDAPDPSGSEGRVAPRAGAGGTFPIDGKWEWGRGMGAAGYHQGIDVMADCGLPMVAPEGGRVSLVKSEGSAGNYIVITAPSGEDQVFMHLQSPAKFKQGDRVDPGERIGEVGRTGNASACHLHFEIWTAPGWYEGGRARDPKPDLKRWANAS